MGGGDVAAHDTRLHRRGQERDLRGVRHDERRELLRVPGSRHLARDLRRPDARVGLEDVTHLRPGGVHVLLLARLHDARPEARGHAVAGIEVELVDPVVVGVDRRAVALGEQALGERVPAARTTAGR